MHFQKVDKLNILNYFLSKLIWDTFNNLFSNERLNWQKKNASEAEVIAKVWIHGGKLALRSTFLEKHLSDPVTFGETPTVRGHEVED